MKKSPISRRDFVKTSAVIAASLPLSSAFGSLAESQPYIPVADPVKLKWLDGKFPALSAGATWGVPWPQGQFKKATEFSIKTSAGTNVPLQSWPLAYWPDGSLKWTGHAIPAESGKTDLLQLQQEKTAITSTPLKLSETAQTIEVNTGVITCLIEKKGKTVVSSILLNGKETARDGRLVLLCQDRTEPGEDGNIRTEQFLGEISSVVVEQKGDVRSVIKLEGKHTNAEGKGWLSFILRLYFYAGAESIKIMHTIIYDGDENKDFIKGLGLRFSVPLKDELHNRHVRFIGEGNGVFAEGVRGLSGLRHGPGGDASINQVNGQKVTITGAATDDLQYIPAFGDYTLFQPNADSFEIKKRTKAGHAWLNPDQGRRASGSAFLGTPSGGLAFGIRNFWQSYPAQLDIRNAATDNGEITMWLWAPDSTVMDLRFYHDGMGQDTYAKQLRGLDVTYEDYEPGFGTPKGVARTSEMMIWALPGTPSREKLVEIAEVIKTPPMVLCEPEYYKKMEVFGGIWNLPDRSSAGKKEIEDKLDWYFDFYKNEIDQRKWYGFWNYGDVMHSYDQDRHVWKYDIGGCAWDNSELSTDLWLWYYFLRTGRADAFRVAEAMTRHTGEVDVHHTGRFAPLGSRHNVMHWGCSAKQLRISTATNRRYYYYLTADERVGDLMREQVNADKTLLVIQPTRKVRRGKPIAIDPQGSYAHIGFGTDWGALAGAWLTEWERTGDKNIRDKLLNSMRTIAAQPHGFFSSGAMMELATGKFQIGEGNQVGASHLSAVFGLVEICAELVRTVNVPEFEKAWLQYCELYNASGEEQSKELGRELGSLNLAQSHSRLTAFAAKRKKDDKLAKRAWNEFYNSTGGITRQQIPEIQRISGPLVLNPVNEAKGVSTNGVAQWGLSAIQCLALIGDKM
ncbi:MAG: twin-arginine translocation signal domain-containing protein [Sphingobacteriaceae bacterium]|nr:twin-arginine translocation signal domain-containing protein [Sphingobacteriaceae bacterium]